MGIRLLMGVYYRKVKAIREAERAIAFAQAFVSMVDTDDYGRR